MRFPRRSFRRPIWRACGITTSRDRNCGSPSPVRTANPRLRLRGKNRTDEKQRFMLTYHPVDSEGDQMTRPRVLLADDHTLLLEAFHKLLEDDCEVVGKVGDGRALVEAAMDLRPDVVVVDVAMPVLNG